MALAERLLKSSHQKFVVIYWWHLQGICSVLTPTPVWARGRCRISPPRFLAECCKRQLNQGSFVLLYFRLFTFSDLYWVCLSVFSCTVLFVSISQVIDCEDRLGNDLYCVEWGVKLYSNQNLTRVQSFKSLALAVPGCKFWSTLRDFDHAGACSSQPIYKFTPVTKIQKMMQNEQNKMVWVVTGFSRCMGTGWGRG